MSERKVQLPDTRELARRLSTIPANFHRRNNFHHLILKTLAGKKYAIENFVTALVQLASVYAEELPPNVQGNVLREIPALIEAILIHDPAAARMAKASYASSMNRAARKETRP